MIYTWIIIIIVIMVTVLLLGMLTDSLLLLLGLMMDGFSASLGSGPAPAEQSMMGGWCQLKLWSERLF